MVNKKFNKNTIKEFKLENYNTHFTLCTQRWFMMIVVILTLLLIIIKSNLFKNMNSSTIERFLLFFILLFLLFILTRNTIYTLIGTIILFFLFNILIMYSNKINQININQKNNIESFDNHKSENTDEKESKKELTHQELQEHLDKIDTTIESYQNDKDVKVAAAGLQELLKKLNGGIELKKEDLSETKPLGIDTTQFKDEKKNNALQKAQQETYQLIDSVSALKDTITTLSPVLSQGKEIMSLFENLKL
jgi:ABC-type multidrug transport system fused ATPase/permease subunit